MHACTCTMKRVPTRRAASSRPSMGVGAGTLWREESACFSWLLASLQLLLFVSNLQPVPKEGEPAPPPPPAAVYVPKHVYCSPGIRAEVPAAGRVAPPWPRAGCPLLAWDRLSWSTAPAHGIPWPSRPAPHVTSVCPAAQPTAGGQGLRLPQPPTRLVLG